MRTTKKNHKKLRTLKKKEHPLLNFTMGHLQTASMDRNPVLEKGGHFKIRIFKMA